VVRSVREALSGVADEGAIAVEHVGSTSVEGILAKPVIDLAVGVTDGVDRSAVAARLVELGYLYRGDAGEDGGLLFMLESRPWVRVVHAHVVELGGRQWRDYLALRSVLRSSADARDAYGRVKVDLAAAAPDDPRGYTDGKTEVVRRLLGPG